MKFYFDRHGKYRGYSIGPVFFIVAGVILLIVMLATVQQLAVAVPALAILGALWGLAIWLIRDSNKRRRERKASAVKTPERGVPLDL